MTIRYATRGRITLDVHPRTLPAALADIAAHPGLDLVRSVDGGPWETCAIPATRELVASC